MMQTKRYSTTTLAALGSKEKALKPKTFDGVDIDGADGDRVGRKLVKDKTRAQKGSISFGNEKFEYISDAKDNQRRAGKSLTKEETLDIKLKAREMKQNLTATTFKIGDDSKAQYLSENHQAMQSIEHMTGTERASLSDEVQQLVKKSSLYFGNEPTKYASVASEEYQFNGNTNNLSATKEEVKALTSNLRKHNFSFGEEKINYETDHQRGYKPFAAEFYNSDSSDQLKATIDNTRKTHYSLGEEKGTDYLSTTQRSLRSIEGHPPSDVAFYAQQAKELRQQLQKTTFVVGDDPEYHFSTTTLSALGSKDKALKPKTFDGVDIDGADGDRVGRKLVKDKTRAQKGSISFGNEKFEYISDAKDNQRRAGKSLTKEETLDIKLKAREMKQNLTATTFKIGDDSKAQYLSENHQAMQSIEHMTGTERASLSDEVQQLVKKSSLYFGNEPTKYASVASEEYQFNGNTNNLSATKEEVKALTSNLRKHNFSFGEEKINYETDHQRGYKPFAAEFYNSDSSDQLKATIENTRKTHYSLGEEKGRDYLSTTHRALRSIEGHPPSDVAFYAQQAKVLRQQLQKTTFVVGDDPEYHFSTTTLAALGSKDKALKPQTFDGADIDGADGDRVGRKLVKDKTRAQKGSISFGNDKFEYISDAKDNQRRAGKSLTKEERLDMKLKAREMKQNLTATTFKIGDDSKAQYLSENHQAMQSIEHMTGTERASLSDEVQQLVKKSSMYFGNEPTKYASVASEEYQFNGNTNNLSATKEEVKALTSNLRKHNFSFGEEKINYETDHQRGYKPFAAEFYNSDSSDQLKATIDNTRKTHYSLGEEKGRDYLSTTHRALRTIEGHPPSDVAFYAQQAKELRQQLQRTTFVIGDDPEYQIGAAEAYVLVSEVDDCQFVFPFT